jgi:hypothetical protein
MVPQKPQVWSSCKAHDATEWQRHFERHATPQMGRNCGFWDQLSVLGIRVLPRWLAARIADWALRR